MEHGSVEYFTVEGQWWLPAQPERRVAGTLTFDGDGLGLIVYDALRAFPTSAGQVVAVGSPDWTVNPIVHGRTRDGKDFTLFEVGGANLMGPFEVVREVYRPELALAGCHTDADNFAEVWCSFDYLDVWADPPSVMVDQGDHSSIEVRAASVDLAQAVVGGASVRLVSGVEGTAGAERVQLTRWTSFVVKPSEPCSAKALVGDYARPLQELLMLCLGRPVRLTSLRLLPTDLEDPREATAEAFFAAVQPAVSRKPRLADIESYTAPTILSMRRSPVTADQLLSRWFALWPLRRDVLTLLLVPLNAPFMYT